MANHQQHEWRLPQGYRFAPTDEELINLYLRPKLQNQPLPCNVVEEKQLYGDNKSPWQVFNSDEDKWQVFESFSKNKRKVKRMIYVFVGLKKKKKKKDGDNEDGKQYIRAAGCGSWDGQSGPLDVFDSNGVKIGEKRMLVFELSDTDENRLLLLHGSPNIGYWIMHEYTIAGCDYVLCSISRDDTKKPKINGAQLRKTPTKKETNFMKPKDESKKPKTKLGEGRKTSVKSEKTNATNSRSIDVAMNQGYGEDKDLVVQSLAIIHRDEDERVVRTNTMAIQENHNFLNNVLIPEFSVNVACPVDHLVQNEKDEANGLNGHMELLMGKGQYKGKTAYGISDINKCMQLFDREGGEVGQIVCESYETSSTWELGSADYGQLNYNCNGFAASVLHDSMGIVPGQIIDTRVEQQQQQKQRTSSSVFNVLGKRKSDAAEDLCETNKETFKVR